MKRLEGFVNHHSHLWNLSPIEAIELQKKLAAQIVIEDQFAPIQKIAGADLALNLDKNEGIASHMGLILDIPSIGCAKSVLCGHYQEPEIQRGSFSPLIYRGKEIGAALRTKEKVKPMFISPGHRISLKTSLRIVLECNSGYRLPKPTREADRYVANLKKDPVEINELLLPLF